MAVLKSLPHLLPWPYLIYSKAGLILYMNQAFNNLFIKPLCVGESLENIFAKINQPFTHDWSGTVEIKRDLLKTPDLLLDITIIPDERYPQQFWLFVSMNQSTTLKKAREQLKDKSLFIANICHEIRNSLNIIESLCEISADSPAEEKNQTLQKIFHYSYELKNLVHDVLDFSSYERGGIVLEKVPFDPVEVFEEIVTLNYPATQRKHLELVALACPQSPRSVLGDSMKFRRLIINLLSNAIKFTERGFVHCYLNFKAEHSHYVVSITIHDSGIGITAEQCQKIFEPFTQAEDSTSCRFGGYGLGLSIVRDLVKAMEGNIQVHSKTNEGSRFIATIKLEANPQYELLHRVDLTKNKILLLGGHADIQNWLLNYFNHSQAEVVVVRNNHEAEEIWHQSLNQAQPFTHAIIDLPQDTAPHLSLIPLDKVVLIADRDLHLRGLKKIPKPLTLSSLNHYFGLSFKAKSAHSLNSSSSHSPRHLKILLAEDNDVNREVTTQRLKNVGHHVTAVVDGQAALELWRSKDFDLALIDLQMPLLDGITLIKCIRAEETKFKRRATKLVALTGMNIIEENSLMELGLDDFFLKPIRGNDLIQKINLLFMTQDPHRSLDEFQTALNQADEEELEDLKCAAQIFLRHSESLIQKFQEVMLSTDPESIIKESHSLKGMLALMSCPTLAHFAKELEENPHGPYAKDYGKKLSDGLHRLQESLKVSPLITPHGQNQDQD